MVLTKSLSKRDFASMHAFRLKASHMIDFGSCISKYDLNYMGLYVRGCYKGLVHTRLDVFSLMLLLKFRSKTISGRSWMNIDMFRILCKKEKEVSGCSSWKANEKCRLHSTRYRTACSANWLDKILVYSNSEKLLNHTEAHKLKKNK